MTEATIITYIGSKKQEIVSNNDNFSFNVLPFYFKWNGKEGEINRIEIINDGVRHNNEKSTGKNYQKYQQFAPDATQTDSWSSGQVSISFAEPVAKAEIKGSTLIIDGNHWVDMWRGIYFDSFELTEIVEDWRKGEDNKLLLKIKERKIINNNTDRFFAPTINELIINFGSTGVGMSEYAAKLQVGKKYYFNGSDLENTKILVARNGDKKLDINNSVDKIPEIRFFKEVPEIINHEPYNNETRKKLLRNLDKICIEQTGHLANAELLKDDGGNEYFFRKGIYGSDLPAWKEWWAKINKVEIEGEEINLEELSMEVGGDYWKVREALIKEIKDRPQDWKIEEKKHTHWIEKTIRHQKTRRRHWKALIDLKDWAEIEALVNGSPLPTKELSEIEKLKIIFQKSNIKKISLENGELIITYNNNKIIANNQLTNNSEYQTLANYCQEHNEKEITKEQLGISADNPTNNSSSQNNNHYLVIVLAIGAGAVALVSGVIYLWNRKKKKS